MELFDQKCLIKMNEIATSLLKLAPYDLDTMVCPGLAKYFTVILPNTDWSQVGLSSCQAIKLSSCQAVKLSQLSNCLTVKLSSCRSCYDTAQHGLVPGRESFGNVLKNSSMRKEVHLPSLSHMRPGVFMLIQEMYLQLY